MRKSKGIFSFINSWADQKWKELDKQQPQEPFRAHISSETLKWDKFFPQIQVGKLKPPTK